MMKGNYFFVFFICFFPLFLLSCDILRDSPYEVEGWTPGEGCYDGPDGLTVSLLLSRDSDRIKTEQAFSLTEDGRAVQGNFSWEGRRLFFNPASPLEAGRDYHVSLGTSAQDSRGVSLERKFEAPFSTRSPGGRPRALSLVPGYDGLITEPRGRVRIQFSEPVTVNSCVSSISFSPPVSGSWTLEDNGLTACFVPLDPWKSGNQYRISVNTEFQSAAGRAMAVEFSSRFSIAIDGDAEKPFLLSAWVLNPGKEPAMLAPEDSEKPGVGEYREWESFTRLRLDFSEPVDTAAVRNYLVVEPQAALTMETGPGQAVSVIFRFTENPVWGKSFLIRIKSGIRDGAGNESSEETVYRIRAEGPLSKPPALMGMRLPMAPGNQDLADQEPRVFLREDLFADLPVIPGDGRYPCANPVSTWLELYFDTAPGAEINPFSLMDLFRVESANGALDFSPRSVRDSDFTWPDPAPGWEKFQRLEIRGSLTNTINSGTVVFQISPGLEDNRGNRSGDTFRISLLK